MLDGMLNDNLQARHLPETFRKLHEKPISLWQGEIDVKIYFAVLLLEAVCLLLEGSMSTHRSLLSDFFNEEFTLL